MLARVADWITVITGPLTILGTVGVWMGWFGAIDPAPERSETASGSLAVLIIIALWSFFFFGHLRIVAAMTGRVSETAAIGAGILISCLSLFTVCAIEVLILEALVPAARFPLVQLAWLAVPALAWAGFAWFGVLLVASGEYRREDL
jgi:hypothetical protein